MPHLSRKGPAMSTIRQVASGVHLVELAHVNCYLIEDDDGVTLVDTGLPDHWRGIQQALRHMGKTPGDVRAVVLTHAHFDHMGTAQRWQQEMRVPMWIHDEEMYLAAHPYRYAHENPRALYPLRHPRAVPILFAIARHGALRVKGVDGLNTLAVGEGLDVPGRPRPVFSPGHTHGHCAFHLPDRDAIITGDALVTLDPYTAQRGPRIVAGAATADSDQALRSLEALAQTGATYVLPGHGEMWNGGIVAAVQQAVAAGRA